MPIERGAEWGVPGVLPTDAPVVSTDRAVAEELARGCQVLGVKGGDVARTLGVRAPYNRASPKQLVPVDIIQLRVDDRAEYVCIAHAVIGRSWLGREVVAIMNAAFVGARNVAPRAHPGDGKADVIRMQLSLGDRVKALQRMKTGSHLPHPNISVTRRGHGRLEFDRPRLIRIDGVARGSVSVVEYTVAADAYTLAVS